MAAFALERAVAMLFPTFDFVIFFVTVFIASWWLVDHATWRKALLLVASYVFYAAWDWRFTALLAGSSALNFGAGLALARTDNERQRRWIVGLAIAANLTVLGFFKYFGFFMDSLGAALESLGLARDLPFLEIVLPVGISFFTFQGISYVMDVARREIPAVRAPLDLFLYISFFPQLVAGPIVRAAHFLPQLAMRPQLTRERMAFGLVLIIAGLFKKMVIANYLASEIVDEAFFDPTAHGGIDLWLGVYAYAVQIYCDFSGYSDIGIGVAALLGYHFHANFNQPYRASSLQDFWRRWHISLSEWLRDYLYKPLGGSRGGRLATARNLLLTMLLGGLWHGAAWTFVIWGLIHGTALTGERIMRKLLGKVGGAGGLGDTGRLSVPTTLAAMEPARARAGIGPAILATLATFHIVCFAWIFFRAPDLAIVQSYLEGLTRLSSPLELTTPFALTLVGLGLAFQFVPPDLPERAARVVARLGALGLGLLIGLAIWLVEVIGPEGVAPFIYFQF